MPTKRKIDVTQINKIVFVVIHCFNLWKILKSTRRIYFNDRRQDVLMVNLIVIVIMEYAEVVLISAVVLHSLFQFPLSIVFVF